MVLERKTVGRRALEEMPGFEGLRACAMSFADQNCYEDPSRRLKSQHLARSAVDMADHLRENGFDVSTSKVYRMLEPAKKSTKYAKARHVNPLPVKLSRCRNNARHTPKCHYLNYAFRRNIKEMLSHLGMRSYTRNRKHIQDFRKLVKNTYFQSPIWVAVTA